MLDEANVTVVKSIHLRGDPDRHFLEMTFADFQHLARLSVVGVLDLEELALFEKGRKQFGERAEEYLLECQRLETAFALSLEPQPTRPGAKEKLLAALHSKK